MEQNKVVEVSIADMLCMLCCHWKSILFAVIAGAVLAAGIGRLEKNENKIEETTADEAAEEEDSLLNERLLASYQDKIAVNWEQYETYRTYLERSPLQKLNAEEVFQQMDLYAVLAEDDTQSAYRIALLLEAYQNMASDEKLYEAVADVFDAESGTPFLGELIRIEQRQLAEPSIYAGMDAWEEGIPDSAPGVLAVRVFGKSWQECEQISEASKKVLMTYCGELQNEIGAHTLEKISVARRMIRKPEIIQTRVDIQEKMGECLRIIDEQEKKISALETAQEKQNEQKEPEKGMDVKVLLVLGCVLGAAAGCAYWGIRYLFDGKMHDTGMLGKISGKSGYGLAGSSKQKKGWIKKLCLDRIEKLPVRKIEELAGLAEQEMQLINGEEKQFALISSVQTSEYMAFAEKMEQIGKMNGWNIKLYTGDACCGECLNIISGVQGIIWMEQKDVSENEQIWKISELCQRYKVPVIMNLCIL